MKLPWHSFDEKNYEFVSIYRRRFKLPPEVRGRRVFVDFEGVMTASTVWINGVRLGEYKGGYTPFSFELTEHIDFGGENVLAVDVDSTERPDIPPFGFEIDYLTFGGIYREVAFRIVPATFIENVFARPKDVLSANPRVEVDCYIQQMEDQREPVTLEVELRDRDRVVAKNSAQVPASAATKEAVGTFRSAGKSGPDQIVGIGQPESLYRSCGASARHRSTRSGLAKDRFSRGAIYRPWVRTERQGRSSCAVLIVTRRSRLSGRPCQAGRSDATREILRQKLKCNIVRTSHYPQSRHFLDACDEMGLLVLEEIPGWQHIGDEAWKLISIDNVSRMIRRDWNHPSIILWGVRINESKDDHDFYTRTNAAGPQARSNAPDWRHPHLPGVGIPGRRFHHERFRLAAEAA